MDALADKNCVPCDSDFPPMTLPQAQDLMEHVDGWDLSPEGQMLSRIYKFPDFATAMAFANKIAALAEEEGHHPDFAISWGRLGVALWTHSIGGLSENDFIMAAKINALSSEEIEGTGVLN